MSEIIKAKQISFDNTVASLPNSPITTQQAIEELKNLIDSPPSLVKQTWSMNWTTLVVTDADVATTSVIFWTAQSNASWFIEVIPWNWSFTINSTASETWLIFNYVVFS